MTPQTWTMQAEPFLCHTEALLDSGLRAVLILVLCVGAAGSAGLVTPSTADTSLAVVGALGIAAALLWGNAFGQSAALVRRMLTFTDDRVSKLLFRQVRCGS